MDSPLTDRRREPRLPREALPMPQVTLRPYCPAVVVDLSRRGLQVESGRPLRPGSRVLVRLAVADRNMAMAAVIVRCAVWAVHPEDGVTYRGGLRFDELCVPFWEEQARASPLRNAPP